MKTNKHQKQIVWQIYLPMILIAGVLAIFSFFLYAKLTSGEMDYRIWLDISIMIISLPGILSFIFLSIFLAIVIYLVSKLKPKIINVTLKMNSITATFFHWINTLSRWITQPVIRLESMVTQLFSIKKEKQE